MSTLRLANPNLLLEETAPLRKLLKDKDFLKGLEGLRVDWPSASVVSAPHLVSEWLLSKQYLSKGGLSADGIHIIARLLIDYDKIVRNSDVVTKKYKIEKRLALGQYSATYLVKHRVLDEFQVIKLIEPSKSHLARLMIQKISALETGRFLVKPIDYFSIDSDDLVGNSLKIDCIIYPYVDAVTLDEYLKTNPLLNPGFVVTYIDQLSAALSALEREGIAHEDLHLGNILVFKDTSQEIIEFRVIDCSPGMHISSEVDGYPSDYVRFRTHLILLLWHVHRSLPRISIQKHLGPRLFCLVETICNTQNETMAWVRSQLKDHIPFTQYQKRREAFMQEKFRKPISLGFLRYEEIVDPSVAVALFEPFPELFAEISQFGNALLQGHRGSGKSTYLASVAFFPESEATLVDFKEKFGLFFACRQGEFKQFNERLVPKSVYKHERLKHILVLKILRKFTGLLSQAVQSTKIATPENIELLTELFSKKLGEGFDSFTHDPRDALSGLHDTILRFEAKSIDEFFKGIERESLSMLLNENDLILFCSVVQNVFPVLQSARFYFLFDDAGTPNLSREMQLCVNDLIRCTNGSFCVKVSAEKYSYCFDTVDNKSVEASHDLSVFNISETLSLGSGKSAERKEIKEYFFKVVSRRLQSSGYKSSSITDYLGKEGLPIGEFVSRIAKKGHKDGYYSGWNTIWQLADRTPRHLLELIQNIFNQEEILPSSEVKEVSMLNQHKAVRAFSEMKLRSLMMIPGTLDIQSENLSLGKHLYDFAVAFGRVSKSYLQEKGVMHSSVGRKRYHEMLAIEIDNSLKLGVAAQRVLTMLVRYAVLDDGKLVTSYDEGTKKPIYVLNRIFCPVFGISFRQERYWRMSSKKFDILLTDPLSTARTEVNGLTANNPQNPPLDFFES